MSTKVAVIGSGSIGTDLMIRILRLSDTLEIVAMAGIDSASDGLARARELGVATTAEGVDGLIAMAGFDAIAIVFDATSAHEHGRNAAALAPYGKLLVDLTTAAIGPYVVPAVNLNQLPGNVRNINMVTSVGQATIPIVAAISRVAPVPYAEIVASIAPKSAGPRADLDESPEATGNAIEQVGGATRAKAMIVLNPAEPPRIMRDTVQCLVDAPAEETREKIRHSIEKMVAVVAGYVSGYRLEQPVRITPIPDGQSVDTLAGTAAVTHQVSVFLEVKEPAHALPAYAGNLDIMTSAAIAAAEHIAAIRRVTL